MALSYTNNKNNYKNDTDTRIITDEPTKEAEDFREYSRKLSKIIINSKPRFTVGIYGDWGTGKTTIMQMLKKELDTNYSNNLETIWFDSWRYEREKYSAMIPLLRTIILTLQNVIVRSNDNNKKKILQKMQKGFVKMTKAVISNTGLNISGIVGAGLTFDFGKILDEYTSEGNVRVDQEKITFHKHVSDNLKEELENIKKELNADFRLVIFIDDLDRCTPERALEILESIKTFFDIEGIIYVIGIDPQTIGPIIKTKYENNPKIDGMHYLQKIVQLPFQIPVWSSVDLSNVIRNLVKEARLSESYSNEILKDTNQELIIKATQLNPRDIKRFINSIVLARDIYGQDIKDIDKIIAIQAFYFHGRKWIEFLKLLIPYEQRVKFLTHFILLVERKLKDITILDDLRNIIEDEKYKEKEDYLYKSLVDSYRNDKSLNDVYKELIDKNDNDLFTFLKIASIPLLKIDKIESYLRIVDTTGITVKRKDFKDTDIEKQLKLLQSQEVKEFNDYYGENVLVHLPYAELQKQKLQGINLAHSVLFKADMSGANLTEAHLTGADMSGAKLTVANLSEAKLTVANLTGANLIGANLTEAKLPVANLIEADMSGANLTGANLTRADMSGANLTGAFLYRANLTGANLTRANLTRANLTRAYLLGANLTNSIIVNNIFSEDTVVADTNFKYAIIDNHEFLEYLRKNQCKNIPEEEIRNKQELRLKLESKNIPQYFMDYLLETSKLPLTS
jgi:uncharacterized protein YjbI with pentapeptide repeats